MSGGMHSYDVVVIGSSNLDLVANVERLPSPGETVLGSSYAEHAGGKGLNQAVSAARAGADTAFITCLGRDHAGDTLHSLMLAEGVAAYITDVDQPTGRALICVDSSAENSIVVVPGANAELGIGIVDAHRDVIARARVVLCQLEIPVPGVQAAMAIAKAGGATTILNPAPATELTRAVLQLCDIITPNQHELALLGGPTALLDAGVSTVIVTLGARGMRIITATDTVDVPPFAVRAIDTTGAGDAACGALATAISHGLDIGTAARRAAAAGALAATRHGAVPSLPTKDEIDSFAG